MEFGHELAARLAMDLTIHIAAGYNKNGYRVGNDGLPEATAILREMFRRNYLEIRKILTDPEMRESK